MLWIPKASIIEPNYSLAYWKGVHFSLLDKIIQSGFQIWWLCVSLSIFVLYKAENLLHSSEMEYSLRYIFTINSQRMLTMLSKDELRAIIRRDSALAGVHAAQLLADSFWTDSCEQACARSPWEWGSQGPPTPLHISHLPLTLYLLLLVGGFCLIPWVTSWQITGLNLKLFCWSGIKI